MWLLAHAPPRLLRSVAYPLLLAAIAGLILVLAFGPDIAGVTRWIAVGGIQLQPSEFAKLAFLIWGADLLARKESLGQLNDWRTLLIPLLPGAAVVGLLVILGDDLGTTFLLLVILLALLWVIGTPARLFVGILGLVLFALVLLIKVAQYRSGRITGFLNPTLSNNWQLVQGKWAIGSGGLFGVGLGDSQQKWGWVPNDRHRLHLRDPRRGTRPDRHRLRRAALRRAGLRRAAGRQASHRSVHAAGSGGRDRLDRGAGAGEHLRGDRPAADHRGAAAADLAGPVLGAGHDGRDRHAARASPGPSQAPGKPWRWPPAMAAAGWSPAFGRSEPRAARTAASQQARGRRAGAGTQDREPAHQACWPAIGADTFGRQAGTV